jgi:cbb3-type cytochrome oxidase subunit 3
MDLKKILIAGIVIGGIVYFYNKSKKAKATPKAETSSMDAALMARMK